MVPKVVSMEELRPEVLLKPEHRRESVAEVCARRRISRASFYRYRARFCLATLACESAVEEAALARFSAAAAGAGRTRAPAAELLDGAWRRRGPLGGWTRLLLT